MQSYILPTTNLCTINCDSIMHWQENEVLIFFSREDWMKHLYISTIKSLLLGTPALNLININDRRFPLSLKTVKNIELVDYQPILVLYFQKGPSPLNGARSNAAQFCSMLQPLTKGH